MGNYTRYCPFPVGSIFITTDYQIPTGIRPNTYRIPFGKGRVLVCVDNESQNVNLKTPEKEFGTVSQQITVTKGSVNEWDEWSTDVVTDVGPAEGGKITISHYQPSITVYMRKRVENKSEVTNFNGFNIEETPENVSHLYWDNAIIDYRTMQPKKPDPYNP